MYEHESCSNSLYYFVNENDCANFVSQCLAAGGFETGGEWSPHQSAWESATSLRKHLTENGLFYHSTYESDKPWFIPGTILNWIDSNGNSIGHVGIVNQNDSTYFTFCAHTACRNSSGLGRNDLVDYYVPYWDSEANDWNI